MVTRDKNLEPWQKRQSRSRVFNMLPPRQKFLIITGGETETAYFSNYRTSTGPKVITVTKSIHQQALVQRAISERQKLINRRKYDVSLDESWVVIDRDLNPVDKQDGKNFGAALSLAKSESINVAFSNDAFELWFVLHFEDLQRYTPRQDLYKLMEKHLGRPYKKGNKENIYSLLRPHRQKALERAAALYEKDTTGLGSLNPCTSVHLLVKKLIDHPGFLEGGA